MYDQIMYKPAIGNIIKKVMHLHSNTACTGLQIEIHNIILKISPHTHVAMYPLKFSIKCNVTWDL